MRARFALTILCILMPAALAAADVPRVRNADMPRDGVRRVHLEEVWRAGSDAGRSTDDRVFGMITRVRQDANGDLYVMDAQLSEVHVYSSDGRHLRTLFGEGEGPGEIRGPRDIVLLDDGRVGAVQEMPGKLVFVDRTGDPAGNLRVGGAGTSHGGFCQTFAAFGTGSPLLVAGFVQKPGESQGHLVQTSFLSSFDADGLTRTEFAKTVNEISLADFVFEETRHLSAFWWNAAVAPDGDVYVAPDLFRYAIEVRGPDGALKRIIERDYSPWRRTKADKDRFTAMVRAVYHGAPFEVPVDCADVEPVIHPFHRGLRMRPDGGLHVVTTRGLRTPDDGAMVSIDAFDRAGVFTERIDVHGPWDGRTDAVFFLDDDRAVVITGYADAMVAQFTGGNMAVEVADEEGSIEVICCRVIER